MVSDTPQRQSMIVETKHIQHCASSLLKRLIENRRTIELRYEESGRIDPLKSITGRSALDEAIDLAREMVEDTDHLLNESNGVNSSHGIEIDRTSVARTVSVSL
ncbi:MAG: hypothetical protein O7G85_03110 [Planctomycetota bacterium]|nr:hypothetical protein [Planctomycetota bacterium]